MSQTAGVEALDVVESALADRKARRDEYATWRANKVIHVNGARAFNPGDAVPNGHVERGVVSEDDVTRAKDAPAQIVTRPKDSGSLADWQAFALQEGMDPTEAADASRADLIKRFPKAEG